MNTMYIYGLGDDYIRDTFISSPDDIFNGPDSDVRTLDLMSVLAEYAEDMYHCNRPPKVAAALLIPQKGSLIMTGVYATDGSPNCTDIGCEMENGHCVRTVHAEQRAICLAAKHGVCTEYAYLFSTLKPCYQCSKLIITAGIKQIYYIHAAYDEERTRNILSKAHLDIKQLKVKLDIDNGV